MSILTRFARLTTNAVVRWPRVWPLLRPAMERQFDAIAPVWDDARDAQAFDPLLAALEAVDGPVASALDAGTGTGEGALALARRFPNAEVVGVDVADEMLARARRKLRPGSRIRFERADAARLPFAEASFDLVAHANTIPFFDELKRVLRPGGWAVFAFSVGRETPIYVPPERLRRELARRGFVDFAEFSAGRGTALAARRR